MDVEVRPGRISGSILVPGSKSVAQRALILATRRGGTILNVPESNDVRTMGEGLRALGFTVEESPGERTVSGSMNDVDSTVDVGDNGTAARCLAALAAVRDATTIVTGSERMQQRPMKPLCDALRELGATVEGDNLPLTIRGPVKGGMVKISTELSSQFATALIMLVEHVDGLKVQVSGRRSFSYVGLTAYVQRHFADPYVVEPDFSSAAPFAVAAATTGGDLLLRDLSLSSPQPDARLFPFLNRAGASVTGESAGIRVRGDGPLTGITADLSSSPDLAPLLGVVGALAEGETIVQGAPHLSLKESDRIASTVAMIRALGGDATPHGDGFSVRGGLPLTGAFVSAESDHRIAMAASVLALSVPGVTVSGAEAVRKSYPGFFADLDALTE
ncbi:MAG: 3-phosphoshikimate 1-carboxyvinyltransferase [Planctomycetota bacterium]|jgi:3-phosphoshikimate 1-carboxyvinyltransferase